MDLRNNTTGEIAPGHCIGSDENGDSLYLVPDGWTPVGAHWLDEDGHAHEGVRIEVTRVTGTELYHRYPTQTEPQGCYIELCPSDRQLSAGSNAEIGNAVPMDVWHGRRLRFSIPCLTETTANRLLDKIAPLAARVCDGYSCEWDGGNHVGRYNDDAREAMEEIERLCDEGRFDETDMVHAWDAAEWYAGLGSLERQASELGITATTTDEELRVIEARETEKALADGVAVLDRHERHLKQIREHLRDE